MSLRSGYAMEEDDCVVGSQSQFVATQNVCESQDDFSQPDSQMAREPWGRLTHTPMSSLFKQAGPYDLIDNESMLGRSKHCHINLKDPSISSFHCKVYREGNTVFVKDVGSTNGTSLNGVKLKRQVGYELHDGDKISLVRTKENRPRNSKNEVEDWYQFRFETNLADHMDVNTPKIPKSRKYSEVSPCATPAGLNGGPIGQDSRPRCEKMEALYSVKEQIGKGGYATVYRVVDRETGEQLAVKIIEKRQFQLNAPHRWRDQLNEAEILRKLNHPGIIKLKQKFATDEALFLVMELVRGGELFDRLVEGACYTEERAKLLTKNLLEAVKYLHDNDIVHRDLKPENILLVSKDDDTTIKLADFGVAKEERGGRATVCGTVNYIAPEVLKRQDSILGEGRYGKSVDMWSLGVVVFIMLTKCPPFEPISTDDKRSMEERVSDMFHSEEWMSIPPPAQNFVGCLLQIDETRRLTAAHALQHPWITSSVPSKQTEHEFQSESRTSSLLSEHQFTGPKQTISSPFAAKYNPDSMEGITKRKFPTPLRSQGRRQKVKR